MATAEERLAKIKEKQAQLKAQEKKIITQEKAEARGNYYSKAMNNTNTQ